MAANYLLEIILGTQYVYFSTSGSRPCGKSVEGQKVIYSGYIMFGQPLFANLSFELFFSL